MLFSATKNFQLLKNREHMRRLLVTVKRKFTIAQVVDNYNVAHHRADDVQKKPPKSESSPCEGRRRRGDQRSFQSLLTVQLRGWSNFDQNQILFHNEPMRCCRKSLQQLPKKRATLLDMSLLSLIIGQLLQAWLLKALSLRCTKWSMKRSTLCLPVSSEGPARHQKRIGSACE